MMLTGMLYLYVGMIWDLIVVTDYRNLQPEQHVIPDYLQLMRNTAEPPLSRHQYQDSGHEDESSDREDFRP